MAKVFISYKRVDKFKVLQIKEQLESALDEKCWIDLDGIESDAQFVNIIIRAIDECEVFLFMYSKAHSAIKDYENDWTIRELSYAAGEHKRVVIVNIDKTPLVGWFKFMYANKQQIDWESGEQKGRLIDDLSKWLHKPVFSNFGNRDGIKRTNPDVTLVNLCLESKDTNVLELIRLLVMEFNIGLKEAKGICDSVPCVLPKTFTYNDAELFIAKVRGVGAGIRII